MTSLRDPAVALQRAADALKEARTKLEELDAARNEPIAIVGMACRFPGAPDLDAFWRLLVEGRDGIRALDERRWPAVASAPQPARWAGLLERLELFDADFFGISPREARVLDPQQRLLLEQTWCALENALLVPSTLHGSKTGVYVGISTHDYGLRFHGALPADAGMYVASGNTACFAAGRLSYVFGFEGPCLATDTGCSSSLVAVHLAVQSLRNGESERAIVAGTNAILAQSVSACLATTGAMSRDGRCRTFDAAANGMVRGEGCGVVVLERLSDALRKGRKIWAIIRGISVNSDGRSSGLTAPNAMAQERVLRDALQAAKVEPAAVGFIETHGTGTVLGDPIEFAALSGVYGAERDDTPPCYLGALKTNVGHLEAAAGIAGIIKTALVLHHGIVPPNVHYTTPNPLIQLAASRFVIPTFASPWPAQAQRIAAVSSFGLSGTNAHAIIEQAPAQALTPARQQRSHTLLALSARNQDSLRALCARYADQLALPTTGDGLENLCGSSNVHREHFSERAAFVADSRAQLEADLRARVALANVATPSRGAPKLAMLFAGQGSQYANMGRALYESSALFRAEFQRCETIVAGLLNLRLGAAIHCAEQSTTPALEQTLVVQPALFALEYALAQLWLSWGVRPDYVLGHSLGHYVAACVAEVFRVEDALALVCARAQLMQSLCPEGGLLVVRCAAEELRKTIAAYEGRVAIAAINGPTEIAVGGSQEDLLALMGVLARQGVRCHRLPGNRAFHSPLVEPMLGPFRERLASVTLRRPQIPLVSDRSGQLVTEEVCDPDYWLQHTRGTVLFADAVATLRARGVTTFLEVGARATLLGSVAAVAPDVLLLPSLREGAPDWRTLQTSLGALYCAGASIDWRAWGRDYQTEAVHVPNYPFNRTEHWSAPASSDARSGPDEPSVLGRRVTLPPASLAFATKLQKGVNGLTGVIAGDRTWLSPSEFLTLFLAAGQASGPAGVIESLNVEAQLELHADSAVRVHLVIQNGDEKGVDGEIIRLYAQQPEFEDRDTWKLLASARLRLVPGGLGVDAPNQTPLEPPSTAELVTGAPAAPQLSTPGFELLSVSSDCAWLRLEASRAEASSSAPFHAALEAARTVVEGQGVNAATLGRVTSLSWTSAPARTSSVRVRFVQSGEHRSYELHALDARNRVLAVAHGIELGLDVPSTENVRRADSTSLLYEQVWQERALRGQPETAPRRWLLLRGDDRLSDRLSDVLVASGLSCTMSSHAALHADPAFLSDWLKGSGPSGVLDLTLALPPRDAHEDSPNLLEELEQAFAPQLALLRELGSKSAMEDCEILFATARCTPVGGQTMYPAGASIFGLCKVAALEHPELSIRVLDVDARDPELASKQISQELAGSDREPVVAFRGNARLVPRLQRCASTFPTRALDGDGAYLVTGGLGALGQQVVEWLAMHGAKRLVLVNRRAPNEIQAEWLEGLRSRQPILELVAECADVAALEQLRTVWRRLDERGWTLRGVVHTAGVLADAPLVHQSWQSSREVFGAKAQGAWNLHLLCRMPLDFFVMFSSAASLLGSGGQANYAAANAALDAIAHHRRALGLAATAINWGPWASSGMAANLPATNRATGVRPLAGQDALGCFEQALHCDQAQLVAIEIDWRTLMQNFSRSEAPALLSEWSWLARREDFNAELASELRALAPAEREQRCADHVRAAAARVLALPDTREIGDQEAFRDLGMDSLMAVEIRNGLARSLDLRLPATLLFDAPNVASLAEELARRLGGASSVAAPRADRPAALRAREDIAIVGIGCRLPGGVRSPEQLWDLLREQRDTVSEIDDDRRALMDSGSRAAVEPGFQFGSVGDVAGFDAVFFGMSAREALSLDPQQRLLLEVTWEALERAGIPPTHLTGRRVGVFIGISSSEYVQRVPRDDPYFATGNAMSTAAGRLSYLLGLRGPCLAVDTACSSSLAAVHLAQQSLRLGECELAIAGGVSLVLSNDTTDALRALGALSPTQRCRTFDAAADGYVRGEGCAMVVLEPGSRTKQRGGQTLALIRGSAMNHDGRSNGLTAPSLPAQQAVICETLAVAGVEAGSVHFVESHGTGTPLGDPIELQALHAVYAQERQPDRPLKVGALKTNIGHLEAAAGAAGLVKLLLVLERGLIPPNLHFSQATPNFEWAHSKLSIPTQLTPWPECEGERIGAVSSFGFSGTNVHMLLSTPSEPSAAVTTACRGDQLLAISARSREALQDLAAAYASYLEHTPPEQFAAVCAAVARRRDHFRYRTAIRAASPAEACDQLRAQAGAQAGRAHKTGGTRAPRQIAFLLPGQGTQFPAMAEELYAQYEPFRVAIDACARIVDAQLGISLRMLLTEASSAEKLDNTSFTQPALFALEYGLLALWDAYGVRPQYLLGHSLGEYVAATASGLFSLEDGLGLVLARGRLMEKLSANGAMVALSLSEQRAEALISDEPLLGIAAINGANLTTVSGERAAVDRLIARCTAQGVRSRRLHVSTAFHSPLMDSVAVQFAQELQNVRFGRPTIPWVSNVTGKLAGDEVASAGYWLRQLREPVRFAEGLACLKAADVDVYVECGPGVALSTMLSDVLATPRSACSVSSLVRGVPARRTLMESLGTLYDAGAEVRWEKVYGAELPARALPTYPFQRQHFWAVGRQPIEATERELRSVPAADGTASPLDGSLFEVGWKSLVVGEQPAAASDWLILSEQDEEGQAVAAELNAAGAQALTITGPELERALSDVRPLLAALRDGRETRVVYICARDRGEGGSAHDRFDDTLRAESCVLRVLQRITGRDAQAVRRVYVTTRNALRVRQSDPPVSIPHAAVWGLLRAAAWEHPELRCTLIDLSALRTPQESRLLSTLLLTNNPETQLALRGKQVLAGRLQRARASTDPSRLETPMCHADGSYIITGSLVGLAASLARWLATAGAGEVVVVGRGSQPLANAESVGALQSAGVNVRCERADVTSRDELARVLADIRARGRRIRGVFHLAGLLDDALLSQQSDQRLARVLAPKLLGALHLHELTLADDLDYFVLYSSAAAVVGSPGQANYAAANATLDALAAWRSSYGLPALSVAWGAFSGAGMAERLAQHGKLLAAAGLSSLTPEQGTEALALLLARDDEATPQPLVMRVDAKGEHARSGPISPFLSEVLPTNQDSDRVQAYAVHGERLQSADDADIPELLREFLSAELMKITRISPELWDTSLEFSDLGIDSLMGLQLIQRVDAAYGLRLSPTVVWTHPNLPALVDHLARTWRDERLRRTLTAAPHDQASTEEFIL